MGFFDRFTKVRTDGETFDGQGEERRGMIDVVRYNGEADELVWKFPYDNLSTGAQLVVNQSQEAIFFKGGAIADVFGPGTHTLSAKNLPILQKLVNLPFGGQTPFVAEVWFINKTIRRNLGFGTPSPIDLLDPLYGVTIPVRSYGSYGIQIEDSSAFVTQMVGTLHLTTDEDITDQFRALIVRKLSTSISKYILMQKVSVVQLGAFIDEISTTVKQNINEEFAAYGLKVTNFDIESINYDKDDPNVRKIMNAQTEASSMDFESAALARKRQREGYTYQQERQFDVMQDAAGNTGAAGTMMGAGMGIGMGFGVGGAFGAQMGQMANVMQQGPQTQGAPGSNIPPTQTAGGAVVPPPIPQTVQYHISLKGTAQGPFDMAGLQAKVASGELTPTTNVWKPGMPNWELAQNVAELQGLFGTVPPPIPAP